MGSQSLNQPLPLLSAAESRAADRAAVAAGTAGFDLMQRAARNAFRVARLRWPEAKQLTVVCGTGNNGGDGLVLAGLALRAGLSVRLLVSDPGGFAARLKGEAAEAWAWLQQQARVPQLEALSGEQPIDGDLIVDGLLGTGLSGPVSEAAGRAIARINASAAPVLSLDIPSGLCADTGRVLGAAVRAAVTVTFIGLKRGLLTGEAAEVCGELLLESLEVPDALVRQAGAAWTLLDDGCVTRLLPRRSRVAHKGHFGHLLIIGGDRGMAGAALMAGQAALRAGAGLVTLATRPEHVAACVARCPEMMVHGVGSGQELEPLLRRATHILIGPGLGQSAWSGQLLNRLDEVEQPLVVDADGLNLLSEGGLLERCQRDNWILTPHPGEAARLLGWERGQVQQDRFIAAQALQSRYGGVAVLKGAGTLIASEQEGWLCRRGNPGMASGGMGDVLAGLIAGLLAQGLDSAAAACTGVQLHAWSADCAAQEEGEAGLLATDLLPWVRRLRNAPVAKQPLV